jgi:hypothetical protein
MMKTATATTRSAGFQQSRRPLEVAPLGIMPAADRLGHERGSAILLVKPQS